MDLDSDIPTRGDSGDTESLDDSPARPLRMSNLEGFQVKSVRAERKAGPEGRSETGEALDGWLRSGRVAFEPLLDVVRVQLLAPHHPGEGGSLQPSRLVGDWRRVDGLEELIIALLDTQQVQIWGFRTLSP